MDVHNVPFYPYLISLQIAKIQQKIFKFGSWYKYTYLQGNMKKTMDLRALTATTMVCTLPPVFPSIIAELIIAELIYFQQHDSELNQLRSTICTERNTVNREQCRKTRMNDIHIRQLQKVSIDRQFYSLRISLFRTSLFSLFTAVTTLDFRLKYFKRKK